MRSIRTLLTIAAATTLGAASFSPAAAQAGNYAAAPRATYADPIVRTLATYRFASARVTGMPFEVTIADSAGTLVGSYRLRGSATQRPMIVTTTGSDLVLQGATPHGVLTIRLDDQNGGADTAITGHWWLGNQEGDLTGRVTR